MGYVSYTFEDVTSDIFPHAKVLTGFIIDKTAGVMTIEVSRTDDEIRHIEGEETFAIETAGIPLRQHKGLSDNALVVNVTEIGSCEEPIIATGTQHEPAGVRAPIVERLCIVGVRWTHRTALSCSKVEQPEIGLMMPDAELSVVGKCVANESSVIGGPGKGY